VTASGAWAWPDDAGLRFTPQRKAVADELRRSGKEISAEELYDRVKRKHSYIGRATVYRSVDRLVEARLARRLERPGHVSAYVWCGQAHHHHLICTDCRNVTELDESAVAPLAGAIARKEGFRVDHATLDFYGQCRECAAR
jgi:Fur family ferric uptake transcriptional regulator